jgi:hypothetical protein
MKRIHIIPCVLTAALIAVSLAGCGDSVAKTSDTALNSQQQAPQQEKASMAKVVSLDGDQLTVVLADMPGGRGDGGQPGNGATPPSGNTPPDGTTPPDGGNGSASASGSAIGNHDSNGGPGQGGGKIAFSTEQTTYTLSNSVSVMTGTGDSAAEIDLSDLKADDVIRFTTMTDSSGNEVIDSITVME